MLEIFDCAAVDTSTLSSLVAGGMADLALVLAAPGAGAHLSAADSAACAAAAGQWSAALQTLVADYKGSIYFPKCVSVFIGAQSIYAITPIMTRQMNAA